MFRTTAFATILLALTAPAAMATGHGFALIFDAACNENGAVLTFPNADPPFNTRPLYLGKSCDAFSETGGQGRWFNTEDGGFTIELAETITRFGATPPPCDLPRCPA